ncbi:hypothetical protein NDU88_002961 [Pleurodeles waltl]|uniref:Uncharacterized protein n=1 Tax=Pleurodeles waltl TaxID=8319 RepID=A0AAV7VCT9_PLEWA|nr:hypothetical protein NDU88_002961 [Pleurodeles waltl]
MVFGRRKRVGAVCGRWSLPPAPPFTSSRLAEIEAAAQRASQGHARPDTVSGHRDWWVSWDTSFPVPQIPHISRDP